MNAESVLDPLVREVAHDLAVETRKLVERHYGRPSITQWRTISQFCEECPAFSKHRIKESIADREKNGLEAFDAVVRDGGRWLIHLDRFEAWWLSHPRNRSTIREATRSE